MADLVRIMVCPFCGYQCESRGIGAVHCGPHGGGHFPAVRMIEKEINREEIQGEVGHES